MKLRFILMIVACAVTLSCNTRKSSDGFEAVKRLAESGEHIDIDIAGFAKVLPITGSEAGLAPADSEAASAGYDSEASAALKNDKDKAYAALYRFYSHVQLVDSSYVCTLKSAEEINVAPSVFETLKGNLDDMNRQIRALRQSGEKVSLPEIDDDYLRRLLR